MSKKATNETKLGASKPKSVVAAAPAKAAAAVKAPAVEKKAPVSKPVQAKEAAPVKAKPVKVAKAPKVVSEPAIHIETATIGEIPSTVTLIANVDVGFGNALYVRGEGPGLSWEKGLPLENKSADRWQISLEGVSAPLVFKFLVNDQTWSQGEDYVAAPGSSASLSPVF